MTRWQRALLDFLYVAVESIPWFMAITVLATAAERTFLQDVSDRIKVQINLGEMSDPAHAAAVAEQLALRSVEAAAGPGLWLVVLAGLGGFWLMRGVHTLRLGGALGAIVVLVGSVLGLDLLLHIALAGNVSVWDNSGLAEFIDNPSGFTADGADFEGIVERGDIILGSGTAIAVVFLAMTAVWIRFAAAARSTIGFERVLRSFGIGFIAVLVILVFARINDIGQLAPYALPYFVLGLLALAVANSERAALRDEGRDRVGPWSASVSATLLVLFGVAAVFGLAAALDFASFASWAGGWIGRFIEWLLVIILTPIFWVLVPLFDLIIPDSVADRLSEIQLPEFTIEEAGEAGEEGESGFPSWPLEVVKLTAFVGIVWIAYRISRALLGRSQEREPELYDEIRSNVASGGGGLGGLLRGLFRGRRHGEGQGWFRLQPIYALYGRSVVESEDRGFERRPSETPLEYAAASARALEAPIFGEIADAFDAARYGRHYPDEAQLTEWRQALRAWESSHPKSEELRHALELLRPPRSPKPVDPADEFAERVKRGREVFRRMRSEQGLGPGR